MEWIKSTFGYIEPWKFIIGSFLAGVGLSVLSTFIWVAIYINIVLLNVLRNYSNIQLGLNMPTSHLIIAVVVVFSELALLVITILFCVAKYSVYREKKGKKRTHCTPFFS